MKRSKIRVKKKRPTAPSTPSHSILSILSISLSILYLSLCLTLWLAQRCCNIWLFPSPSHCLWMIIPAFHSLFTFLHLQGSEDEKEREREDDHHFGHLHYSERDKKTKVMITSPTCASRANTHKTSNSLCVLNDPLALILSVYCICYLLFHTFHTCTHTLNHEPRRIREDRTWGTDSWLASSLFFNISHKNTFFTIKNDTFDRFGKRRHLFPDT